MSRSLKKGAFFHYSLIKKTKNKKDFRVVQLWSRSSTIIPEFVGQNFSVHNGKSFISITVTEDMIGHKFGEFALTRKQVKHKQKKIKR